MRDLYFKLGIERSASADEIAEALERKPEMSVYAPILLNAEKRAAYDRTHATLGAVGELRHQLGLNSGNSEFMKEYPEFALRRSAATSAKPARTSPEASGPEETQEIRKQESAEPKPPARSKWLAPVLLGLAVVILLVFILTFF